MANYQKDRIFRVKNKIIVEGGVYHVIQRAPGRERLFLEDSDYLYFLHLLKETASKYVLDIFSFVLMSNHLHILLKINTTNLPEAMKSLYQRYALYFNLKYQRKGHVFSGVYRTSLCNSDLYLLGISVYIHLNPVKAGMVEEAGDYRWSSIQLYLDEDKSKFVKSDFILGMLNKDRKEAKQSYKDLLEGYRQYKYDNCFKDKKWLNSFMNSFKRKLSNFPWVGDTSLFESLEIEKKITEIRDMGRTRDIKKIEAKKYLIQQMRSNGYSIQEIGNKLGMTRQSIYKILK
jgi:putative transposase